METKQADRGDDLSTPQVVAACLAVVLFLGGAGWWWWNYGGLRDTFYPIEAARRQAGEVIVGAAEYGDAWMFSVERVILRCRKTETGLPGVTILAGNEEYGINGVASSYGYPQPNPIWLTDPNIPGGVAKKSLGNLIERGLELCD